MAVKALGRFIADKAEQPLKALSPIVVTPSGIVTLVSLLQPANAYLPIDLTVDGITMLVISEL